MKFEVKKIDGSLSFEAEIECGEDETYGIKLGLAIHWGYKNKKDLTKGNYNNAVFKNLEFFDSTLDGSTFVGSRFVDSRFFDTTFVGSRFVDTTLDGSTFDGSRFVGSRFDSSRFVGTTFVGSRFVDTMFVGSTFDGSRFDSSRFFDTTFVGTTFVGSTFDEKTIRNFKHDLWGVLLRYKNEVPKLIEAIKEGKIDGSVYSGECSCLMGTIASIKGCDIEDSKFNIKDPRSAAECWFVMIKKGDTPETNLASNLALEWIEEFLILVENK